MQKRFPLCTRWQLQQAFLDCVLIPVALGLLLALAWFLVGL